MKVIYYILTGLILGIALLSGCVQQEKGFNGEIKGLPEQTGIVQPPPGSRIDYSYEYPASAANVAGFEMKKTGSSFVVYYHPDDENRAN